MAQTRIYLANEKIVIADFQRQGKEYEKATAKSMKVIGKLLALKQKSILGQKVIKWTGALSNSIVSKPAKKSVTVGGTIKYTDWVEAGGRGSFMGYWYMRSSLQLLKGFIIDRLRKDMEVQKPK